MSLATIVEFENAIKIAKQENRCGDYDNLVYVLFRKLDNAYQRGLTQSIRLDAVFRMNELYDKYWGHLSPEGLADVNEIAGKYLIPERGG